MTASRDMPLVCIQKARPEARGESQLPVQIDQGGLVKNCFLKGITCLGGPALTAMEPTLLVIV